MWEMSFIVLQSHGELDAIIVNHDGGERGVGILQYLMFLP